MIACCIARLRHGHAADAQRHGHVVQRAELGQQVVELVDEADLRASQARSFAIRQGDAIAVADDDRTALWLLKQSDDMQ